MRKDETEARRWTEQAARGGDAKAMHNLALYYFEGLTFKEIGKVLGVSESRVYQLHTQAMTRLRAFMKQEGGVPAR